MKSRDKKVFAIGDIHGCVNELIQLLEKLPLESDSQIVFLGDYIDRGPDSQAVIEKVLELKKQYDVVCLKGNHEAMLLDFLDDPGSSNAGLFILNGGNATLASYAGPNGQFSIPAAHEEFFRSLRLYYEIDNYFFVHAGVPNVALNKIDAEKHGLDLMWIRSSFHKSKFKWKKIIVHGHSVVDEVEQTDKRINLDTGCVFQGKLTAIQLPERILYSVRMERDVPHRFVKDVRHSQRVAARFTGTIPVFVRLKGDLLLFETLNYNEFGMLLHDLEIDKKRFKPGDIIVGVIGAINQARLEFKGKVVRANKREDGYYYGIKMLEPLREIV